jgi:hypothetical protein
VFLFLQAIFDAIMVHMMNQVTSDTWQVQVGHRHRYQTAAARPRPLPTHTPCFALVRCAGVRPIAHTHPRPYAHELLRLALSVTQRAHLCNDLNSGKAQRTLSVLDRYAATAAVIFLSESASSLATDDVRAWKELHPTRALNKIEFLHPAKMDTRRDQVNQPLQSSRSGCATPIYAGGDACDEHTWLKVSVCRTR